MYHRPFPLHIQRTVDRFRNNPSEFFQRSPEDKAFFIEQISCWVDQQLHPPHPNMIRVHALSMTLQEKIALETLALRFLRKLIFPDFPEVTPPDSWEWFTYRFFKSI